MMSSSFKKYSLSLSSILLLLIIWQIIHFVSNTPLVFPSIIEIFNKLWLIITSFNKVKMLLFLILKVLAIIIISMILSLVITYIYLLLPISLSFIKPIIKLLQAAPLAIISVYVFLTLKTSLAPYIISLFVIFPLLVESMTSSVNQISSDIKDDLRLLDGSMFYKTIKVFIPMIAPNILISLLQSFGLGVKTMIMAEYICQVDNTIGQVLINTKYDFDFASLLAWLFIIVAIVMLVDFSIKKISKHLISS